MDEVQPRYVFAAFAAEPGDGAVREHHFKGEQLRAGRAVFYHLVAAGVFGDVAADEGGVAAAGVSRVEQAVLRRHAADLRRYDAGLGGDGEVFLVEFEDAVHLFKAHDDAAPGGERAAGEPGASAARRYGDFMFIGDFHYFRDVFGAFWEEEQLRGIFFVVGVLRHLVVRVGLQFFFVRADVVRAYFFFKGRGDFRRNFIVRKDIVH